MPLTENRVKLRPVFANLCTLFRMRSVMVSRSSWENTEAIYIMACPTSGTSGVERNQPLTLPRIQPAAAARRSPVAGCPAANTSNARFVHKKKPLEANNRPTSRTSRTPPQSSTQKKPTLEPQFPLPMCRRMLPTRYRNPSSHSAVNILTFGRTTEHLQADTTQRRSASLRTGAPSLLYSFAKSQE